MSKSVRPAERMPWEDYPWWKKCALWIWWKPRLLWRVPMAVGNAVRDHHTGEVVGRWNWRGAWIEQSAMIEYRMGMYYEVI